MYFLGHIGLETRENLSIFEYFMAILVGPTQNLSILPHQKWRKIKMAAIWPNFEVRDRKLVYNPKLHM